MNDYHKKPSIAVPNEAQYSNSDRNLSYVFDDHRLEQSREPKKTEKSTYYTKYNYDWNGPKVSLDRIISALIVYFTCGPNFLPTIQILYSERNLQSNRWYAWYPCS